MHDLANGVLIEPIIIDLDSQDVAAVGLLVLAFDLQSFPEGLLIVFKVVLPKVVVLFYFFKLRMVLQQSFLKSLEGFQVFQPLLCPIQHLVGESYAIL